MQKPVALPPLIVSIALLALQPSPLEAVPLGDRVVRLFTFATGLADDVDGIDQLTAIDMTPLGDGRQLVLTLGGLVRLIVDGTVAPGAYLDVNDPMPPVFHPAELGPVSIAAHPGFLNPGSPGFGKFYTITQSNVGTGTADFGPGISGGTHHQDVVTEYTVSEPLNTPLTSFIGTKREVLRADRPSQYHTVLDLAFDNEHYLYIASGDGGFGAAPAQAQINTNILGTILRIDPLDPSLTDPSRGATGGKNDQYRIHPNNFGVTDGDPTTHEEIFSFGHRSPYRLNADRQTGEMWLGEVGLSSREEVSRPVNGGNFGWPQVEGTLGTAPAGAVPPTFELFRNESTNVVGGFVYRGSALPGLHGLYIFGDLAENNSGQPLFYGDPSTDSTSSQDDFFEFQIHPDGEPLPERIYSIAEDENGELYILGGPDRINFNNGTDSVILKLVPGTRFYRGDCNGDNAVDLSDAVFNLSFQFSGGPPPDCREACEVNEDQSLDLSDAIHLLSFVFLGGPPPEEPFPDCGADPQADSTLSCAASGCE